VTNWPAWLSMWALAGLVFAGCKWLTWQAARAPDAPRWRHAAYLLAWPGLDAQRFLEPSAVVQPRASDLFTGLRGIASGVLLLFAVAPRLDGVDPYLTGWIGMVGLVLVLHFGAFHLLSFAWRSLGVDARPLMNAPSGSTSLTEFWSRRWNTAFRDLTHRFLFQPLAVRLGSRWGLLAGFLFSGLVHDLVISVPAGGGYGGPTGYFAVQGAAMIFERSAAGRRLGLARGWRGWVFTMAVLVAPVRLLFHPPFVVGIIVPFMRALGAIS
jgi:hypothetical protein